MSKLEGSSRAHCYTPDGRDTVRTKANKGYYRRKLGQTACYYKGRGDYHEYGKNHEFTEAVIFSPEFDKPVKVFDNFSLARAYYGGTEYEWQRAVTNRPKNPTEFNMKMKNYIPSINMYAIRLDDVIDLVDCINTGGRMGVKPKDQWI